MCESDRSSEELVAGTAESACPRSRPGAARVADRAEKLGGAYVRVTARSLVILLPGVGRGGATWPALAPTAAAAGASSASRRARRDLLTTLLDGHGKQQTGGLLPNLGGYGG